MLMVAHLTQETRQASNFRMPRQDGAGTMVTLDPGPCFSS
jgi:hypothetical protein